MSRPSAEEQSFPDRVGRYDLLLPIGTGGMATVYLARVHVVGDVHRQVALKLLHPFVQAEGTGAVRALIDEAKLAVRIRHPNVVPVLEVGEGPSGLFLVMDYVEGDTLSGLVRSMRAEGRTLPLPIAGRILIDALAGLHAAHELQDEDGTPLRLVHRDFSPQNILVGVDGISRLTDFGVAKAENRANVTTSGVIKGKVGYMSPEQALDQDLDRRCDVWAAGVVAWELLAGERLYQGTDNVATLLQIVEQAPRRLRDVRPDLPAELEEVVHAALTPTPEARIPTAAELRRRLVDAWRSSGGIADGGEVGEFVKLVAGERLAARQEQVSGIVRLRRSSASAISETTPQPLSDRGSSTGPSPAQSRSDDTTGAISVSSVGSGTRGPRAATSAAGAPPNVKRVAVAGAAVGLLGIAALAAGYGLRSRDAPAPQAPAAASTVEPARANPDHPTANERAAPAPAKPAVSRTALDVRADAPLAALSLDGKPVPIVSGRKDARVPLDAEAQSQSHVLDGRATDGRRARADVDATTSEVALEFPQQVGPSRAAPTKAKPPTEAKPRAPELPGLAPTPYDAK